ncbi:unnamed protein product [Closterium sp. NIES-54]
MPVLLLSAQARALAPPMPVLLLSASCSPPPLAPAAPSLPILVLLCLSAPYPPQVRTLIDMLQTYERRPWLTRAMAVVDQAALIGSLPMPVPLLLFLTRALFSPLSLPLPCPHQLRTLIHMLQTFERRPWLTRASQGRGPLLESDHAALLGSLPMPVLCLLLSSPPCPCCCA